MVRHMAAGKNWILTQIIEYVEDIISCIFSPLAGYSDTDEPDPPDESLYMEAMQLGIDPATVPQGKLHQAIMDWKSKINT